MLQLVGRRYGIEPHRPWGDDEPCSRIVVIGLPGSVDERELDATMLDLSQAGDASRAAPPAETGGG